MAPNMPMSQSPFVTSHGKGTLQMGLRNLRWEIILDYLGGPNVIPRSSEGGRRSQSETETGRGCPKGFEEEERPQAEGRGCLLELERLLRTLSWSPQRHQPCPHLIQVPDL